MSLSTRIALVASAVLVGFAGVLSISVFQSESALVRAQITERARETAQQLKASSAEALARLDVAELRRQLSGVLRLPGITHAFAIDGEGRVLADGTRRNANRHRVLDDRASRIAAAATETLIQNTGTAIDVTEPIELGEDRIGAIRIGVSLHEVEVRLTAVRIKLLVQAGGFLLIALLLSLLLGRSITRPLSRLVDQTTAVARGDFHGTVEAAGGPEIRTLADSFNRMTSALRRSTVSREYVTGSWSV